jgi:hypothetical protein
MASALAADAAAAATAAAIERARDTAATTAAGRRVASDRDVIERQNTGVENPAAHGPVAP